MIEPVGESVSGQTLRAPRVVLRNPRRMIGLVWLGVLLLLFGTPLLGITLGMLGTVVGLVASLTAFVQAARVQAVRRIGGSVALDAGALRLTGGSVAEDAGVGVAQRALTLPLRGQLGAFTIGFAAVWPLLFLWFSVAGALFSRAPELVFLVALSLTALSTAFVVARFGFPRVTIGTDGVRILGGFLPRFLPYEEIAGVELVPPVYQHGKPSLRILRRKGSPVALPTIAAPRDRVEGLARRIDEAARAHSASGARGLDALARAGRAADEWRADLQRLALAPPTFRDQALGIEDYERVLVDAASAPDRRVGAALALRALDPDRGPARIRVAASASADNALRAALEAAAEGEIDDALLDRAVARRARR